MDSRNEENNIIEEGGAEVISRKRAILRIVVLAILAGSWLISIRINPASMLSIGLFFAICGFIAICGFSAGMSLMPERDPLDVDDPSLTDMGLQFVIEVGVFLIGATFAMVVSTIKGLLYGE